MQAFKKNVMRVISLVTLIAMVFASDYFLGNYLSPTAYQYNFEKDFEKLKKNDETVDIVFVGASRIYMSFVPQVIEEELGLDNVLIAGTAGQPICGSYYMIRDMIDKVHPKKIVMGVTWDSLINVDGAMEKVVVYDRLSLKNKFLFVEDCFDEDVFYLSKTCRYIVNYTVIDRINYEKNNPVVIDVNNPVDDYYADKGFIYTVHSYEPGNMPINKEQKYIFSEDNIISENLEYLQKCVDICKKNGIEFELVTGPMSEMMMFNVEGYQEATDYYKAFAAENDINYNNLSLLYDRENLLPDECIRDHTHINGKGAYVVSKVYAEILGKEQNNQDVSSYFYKDFDEYQDQLIRVVAVDAEFSVNDGADSAHKIVDIALTSYQSRKLKPYYKVEVLNSDGEYELVSDWSQETHVSAEFSFDKSIFLRVTAKTGIEGEVEAFQEYQLW